MSPPGLRSSFRPTYLQSEVPTNPSPSLCNLLEQLTKGGETFIYIYLFVIKGIIKGTGEQLDEVAYRVASRRVMSAGAFISAKLGCHSFSVWLCSPAGELSTLCGV